MRPPVTKSALLDTWLKNKGFNHQRHAIAFAFGLDRENILHALIGNFGLVRNLK